MEQLTSWSFLLPKGPKMSRDSQQLEQAPSSDSCTWCTQQRGYQHVSLMLHIDHMDVKGFQLAGANVGYFINYNTPYQLH
jgi:hypothetical protein